MRIAPYLQFHGNCAEAFAFYGTIFGAAPTETITYGESPMAAQVPAEQRRLIMHTRLAAGDAVVMGSDIMMPGPAQAPQGFNVSINPATIEAAEYLFAALSEGGVIRMPLQETFWTPRFGMLTDKFGTPWMINCEVAAAT